MRSFTIARAAVLPLFGVMLAACSMGSGDDADLALGRGNVSGVEKGVAPPSGDVPSQGGGKDISLAGDVEFIPVGGDAGEAINDALPGGKDIEEPMPADLGKGEIPSKGELPSKGEIGSEGNLPSKGEIGSEGNLPSKGARVVNSACPKARTSREIVGVCVQALTFAKNPGTGECCVYATPCDLPKGWDGSFSQEAVCD